MTNSERGGHPPRVGGQCWEGESLEHAGKEAPDPRVGPLQASIISLGPPAWGRRAGIMRPCGVGGGQAR